MIMDKREGLFSPEIWIIICDELFQTSVHALAQLSYTCWSLNGIANEILYRTVTIERYFTDQTYNSLMKAGWRNIERHTKYLIVDANTNHIDEALDALNTCEILQSLRWEELEESTNWRNQEIISRILMDALDDADPSIGLHATICFHEENHVRDFTDCVDPSRLLSLGCNIGSHLYWSDYGIMLGIGQLLAQADRLTDLSLVLSRPWKEYQLPGEEGSWAIPNKVGKLPAMTRLELAAYDWPAMKTRGAEHFNAVWDFSKVRHLSLWEMNVGAFFRSVPANSFSNLISLEAIEFPEDCFPGPFSDDSDFEEQREVDTWSWEQLPRLQELSIKSHRNKFITQDSLQHVGSQLIKLEFSAHQYVDRREWLYEQDEASVEELEKMGNRFPLLENLALYLNMSEVYRDHERYIHALCAFPKLRILRLQSSTHLHGTEMENYAGIEATMTRIFSQLVRNKTGCRFREIHVEQRDIAANHDDGSGIKHHDAYFCDGVRWADAGTRLTGRIEFDRLWMNYSLEDESEQDPGEATEGYFYGIKERRRLEDHEF